ncbi:MAG TPA: TetR/AcrR family transcriptional regulator [Rhizomicrobium sp.]|jgi:TetR/AcrR family transcriptional repressor of nem operon|nr:TetR/AcrR family transcriptional regulator [Rhizomicrobium sp.]
MRYSETHKTETHERLVQIAGRALRENGPDGVSVADVMQAAGLTHGGFYAHFKSKDALLIEALKAIFVRAREKVRLVTEGLPPRHALAAYIDFYVSERHRDFPANGCALTALNSDMPRQSKEFRKVFNTGVQSLVDVLAYWIAASGMKNPQSPEKLASSILSAMMGAVALSRAVTDRQLSDELLESARTSIKARIGVDDASLSRETVQ